ncbi:8785_t:CDS:2 [Scutellospora calospora]|uniref:8785_t:CDS:1 n=1 Tax=Scutellospora calospora TaxID=85575 RepID=A0ACA9JYT9_9GLOM|nr:8785_t:CDS:2 [Scutellospora calospora]
MSQSNDFFKAKIVRPPLNPKDESSSNNKPQQIIRPPFKPDNTNNVEQNPPIIMDEFIRTEQTGKRNKWTELELYYLEIGMIKYGTKWEKILKDYGKPHGQLRNRIAPNLKDKARNEKLKRLREGIPLGIFELATGD